MENTRQLKTILGNDKRLLSILGGIVLCGLITLGLAIVVGIVYF